MVLEMKCLINLHFLLPFGSFSVVMVAKSCFTSLSDFLLPFGSFQFTALRSLASNIILSTFYSLLGVSCVYTYIFVFFRVYKYFYEFNQKIHSYIDDLYNGYSNE